MVCGEHEFVQLNDIRGGAASRYGRMHIWAAWRCILGAVVVVILRKILPYGSTTWLGPRGSQLLQAAASSFCCACNHFCVVLMRAGKVASGNQHGGPPFKDGNLEGKQLCGRLVEQRLRGSRHDLEEHGTGNLHAQRSDESQFIQVEWRNDVATEVPLFSATDTAARGKSLIITLPSSTHVGFELYCAAPMRELLPGFVHMQGVLPLSTQQSLLDISCDMAGQSRGVGANGGWYRRDVNGQWKLINGNKALFWEDTSNFPVAVKELGERLADIVGERFPEHFAALTSNFHARVGFLNFYTVRGRLGWHADRFRKMGKPTVIASMGCAANFGYKMHKDDAERVIRLDSGDVIVFGGPAHDLVHAVLQVHASKSPKDLVFPDPPGMGRVSVTWRDVGIEDGLTFNRDDG